MMRYSVFLLILVQCTGASTFRFPFLSFNPSTRRHQTCKGSCSSAFLTMKNAFTNKGSSFSIAERKQLQLGGLVPAGAPIPLKLKVSSAVQYLRQLSSPLEKYRYLHSIQDVDETLFYSIIVNHLEETVPFIYTPTVGEACQKWSQIYRQTVRGLYLSLEDRGQIEKILRNYPQQDVEAIVVTDGERILGLGDLGVNGMGIPIGKLALYTACSGIDPSKCLAVHLDVGTNRKGLLEDPMYMGLRRKRERGPQYDSLVSEFVSSCQRVYGEHVLIQFEDFANSNAFRLLDAHRNKSCCFNDDIQGTAAVTVAGLVSSGRITGRKLSEQRYVFYGAGAAAVGIADLLAEAIVRERAGLGMPITLQEAKEQIHLVDSKGLVTSGRGPLESHKEGYAHTPPVGVPDEEEKSLLGVVKALKPSVLVGVSAQSGAFSEEVCREMTRHSLRPVIFSLSNPTSQSECSAEDAYRWTDGRAVYCSGSPYQNVTLSDGSFFSPGQCNNAYIFPAVGLAAVATKASSIRDNDFIVAAYALANQVSEERIRSGNLFPPLENIREISLNIAAAVAKEIVNTKRANDRKYSADLDLKDMIKKRMYFPKYWTL